MAPIQKPGRSEQVVVTPRVFTDAVKDLLSIEAFDLDAAASHDNAQALRYIDASMNALVTPWVDQMQDRRGWVWLNSPFSRLDLWTERSMAQSLNAGIRIAQLVPAAVGANWWQRHVDGVAEVLFLNGRITFVGHDKPYPKDCALLLYGPDRWPGYHVWTWRRDVRAV